MSDNDSKEKLTYTELLDIMLRTATIKAALNSTYGLPKTHELKCNNCNMIFMDEFIIKNNSGVGKRCSDGNS